MPRFGYGNTLVGIKRIDYNVNPGAYAYRRGRTYWDALDLTMAIMQNDGGETVTNQVGQETAVYVRNDSGVDIPNGAVVFYTGSVGQRPSVALAQADSLATCSYLGVATQAIPHNSNGFVTLRGIVREYDTSAWNEGDILRLSPTVAGGLQNTPATSGFNIAVGVVLFKSAGSGVIYVAPGIAPFFGSFFGGNYTQFEYDGTMRAVGGATCFRDELQSLVSNAAVVTPANDIVNNPAECTKTFKASARYPDDYLAATWQLNHDWLLGSSVGPHLHIEQTSAATPNFLYGFRWQKQGQEKTTAWSLSPVTGLAFPWGAYTTLNQILTFAAIAPPVGYGDVSDIVDVHFLGVAGLVASVRRNVSRSDDCQFLYCTRLISHKIVLLVYFT